ncbi:developmental regulator SasN [Myxococcus xanthus DK 1622]|uniref:Developmental regulator SasN n=3 Tax=Myxococcaceae TaxID=31 RepID=Q1DCX0_MYXXD|nr:SasN [Myxococcus xanthus]ABF88232.1 developmental regulator SasN [Myxococcus xanthus DK 1622]QVW69949.1 TetR family transcriptional regulator [Myxococcus xanthus DZ2]NOJ53441.1 TetR family transcriptional regulator [Myxococcus xanthus]QPM80889.1 TetR family transcriptional regulator [Myxococcus xanthus]
MGRQAGTHLALGLSLMNLRSLALLLSLLLAMPGQAASGLEAVRGRAQSARAETRSLRGQQQALRDELNGLAARIETLKAQRQGRLMAGTELEDALRRSQELSGQLTGLAQAVVAAEGEAERAHLALHTALSDELTRLLAAWEGTADRGQREKLLEAVRSVRAEREAIRAALPASQVPSLDKATAGGDDPEDLLAQADTLRDTRDKVRERLKALRGRITEVREERDLDRRMNDFLGEESMFDDQDRRLRLRMGSDRTLQVERSVPGPSAPTFQGDSPDDPTPNVGGRPGEGVDPSRPPYPTQLSSRATDRRPQVETQRAQDLASGGPVDLAAMEAEATRLETLARELEGRATKLERRAQEMGVP